MEVQAVTDIGQPDGYVAPPSYDAAHGTGISTEDIEQLNVAFSSLNVPLVAKSVTEDTCLAHLKLLFAFQNLKEAVGYTDGLWQLYDSRVLPKTEEPNASQDINSLDDETKKNLSLLREKRWALYVARAVDRYEAWWSNFQKNYLTEDDMAEDTDKYTRFASNPPSGNGWKSFMLPPLDVLMVWHAHMLNPQAYYEDCLRNGFREMWHAGMPWQLVNDAIDTNFNYTASSDCMVTWEKITGRKWDNVNDSFTKTLPPCPKCRTKNTVSWSTCGMSEGSRNGSPSTSLVGGTGYGDRDFIITCSSCRMVLGRDYLEVFKFTTDVEALIQHKRPMPGTILGLRTGMTKQLPPSGTEKSRFQPTFPNRLIRYKLRSKVYSPPPQTMGIVRDIIEKELADPAAIQFVESVVDLRERKKRYRLGRDARVHVRKMMSRYWGNSSPFALELGGAVMRQGIFTEKMYKIDWLHSPAARETMTRLIMKYERFTNIMGKNPTNIAVPTLDVDLAWHTHQLSPASYYQWMVSKTTYFVDHDDKIEEGKLSTAFEWTSKTYQELYGEVYSECTCWYCESVRTSHGPGSIASKLSILQSDKDKVTNEDIPAPEKFYSSGRAALCPPDNSAHISAHNAVRVEEHDKIRAKIHKRLHLAHQRRLNENYEKARKRAKKQGRELPPRDDYYYYYWGTPYLLYAPYVYPAYCVCPVYYDTTTIAAGSGVYGACAAGTCGGTLASGACGGTSAGAALPRVAQDVEVEEDAQAEEDVEEGVVAEEEAAVVEGAAAAEGSFSR
ncbi:hypothetical protein RRF57_010656 [Xylaria bambusicola]|uniref:Alpha-ketoglutarate-dependent sulfonate dioxygenase n=1 Tax=Xylaria bambusicola TaxID=326684 RepID=A0AAN7UVB2_9PEZI